MLLRELTLVLPFSVLQCVSQHFHPSRHRAESANEAVEKKETARARPYLLEQAKEFLQKALINETR